MPLTLRSNGSGGSNIITSSWFNDYYNLLTGSMQDQNVIVKNNISAKAIAAGPSSAPTTALASGTSLGIGLYVYAYTYASADGETLISPTVSVTTTSGNQKVTLSGITVGPTGTVARKVYRTIVGGGTAYKLVATIADNTTTTYTDTTADASLGATAPINSTFGGAFKLFNSSNTLTFQASHDGNLLVGGGKIGSTYTGDMLDASDGNNLNIRALSSGGIIHFQRASGIGGTPVDVGQISDGGGMLQSRGLFGRIGYNPIIDASNGNDTYIYAVGGDAHWVRITGTNASQDWLKIENGGIHIMPNNASTNSFIAFGVGLGFKQENGTKLAEIRANGNYVIKGSYQTLSASASIATGLAFDTFDFAEIYEVDQVYAPGTIVCPSDGNPYIAQCPHAGCNLAGAIVQLPGFGLGVPNVPDGDTIYNQPYDDTLPYTQYVSMGGRILVQCSGTIPERTYVVSDGAGKVRAATSADTGLTALGVSITAGPDTNGMVAMLIRPTQLN
jgi:hypothetical protein